MIQVPCSCPKISVIIPVRNGARTLDQCLDAVYRSRRQPHEVIVVDDCSADDSIAVAERFPCRILRLEQNQGAAAAKNRGAETASGDVLFFTDADVLVEEDTLSLVAEGLADSSVAGIVGLLSQQLPHSDFSSQYKNLWMHYTYARLPAYVGVFYTSAAAVRRDVFLQAGGFDENYRGSSVTEDTEFGQRLLTAGHRIRAEKRLTVKHLKHYSFRDLLRTDFLRSNGLAATVLRNRFAHRTQRCFTSVPWYCLLGLPIAYLAVSSGLIALTGKNLSFVAVALACYGILVVLHAPFLDFLRKTRGLCFCGQSCGFLLIDMLVAGVGVMYAVIQFAVGKRY